MELRLRSRALLFTLLCALTWAGCGGNGGGETALTVSATSPMTGELAAPTNRRITATFSAPLNGSTVTTTSFKASTPGGDLVGVVSTVDNTATLLLNANMPANTVITATITRAVRDTNGHKLAADYVWTFTTGSTTDSTAPTVSSIDPADLETGVVVNKSLVATFSEPMRADTVTTATFSLQGPSGPIAGTVTLLNNVATFNPTNDLAPNTSFTATITTGVMDLSDNPMAVNKVWTFTTGLNPDTTAPLVESTNPTANATGVATNETVSATFSEAMNVSTLTTTSFSLKKASGEAVVTTIAYANKVAVLDPVALLDPNTLYVATITTAVKDSAGNSLAAEKVWQFTTAAAADLIPPTVLSTNPANLATNVFRNASINATFSEAMQANTLTTSTFSVTGVAGTVSYDSDNHIATFMPSADLAANTTFTARIEVGAKDAAGNGLAVAKVWTFTTGVQRSQTNIDLGAASTYAVLAGSTVTNGGPTVINGDLGVSPGSAVTGFPPGIVNGAIHAGDSAAAQAKAALLAGQLDAAGRLGGASLPGDLAGLTFTPGLYTNSTSVMLSSGAVTLDAQGDVNAVFIFQMGSTLTTNTGTQVILAGGAQPKNIYWSVGSSATLGVNSIFKGTVLAEVSITVNTGAVHDGTLLTKTGAVTLLGNIVTRGRID